MLILLRVKKHRLVIHMNASRVSPNVLDYVDKMTLKNTKRISEVATKKTQSMLENGVKKTKNEINKTNEGLI